MKTQYLAAFGSICRTSLCTNFGSLPPLLINKLRHGVTFYPIYYDTNLLSSKTTTTYYEGIADVTKEQYTYDSYWRLEKKKDYSLTGEQGIPIIELGYTYPNPQLSTSFLLNSPLKVTTKNFSRNNSNTFTYFEKSSHYTYQQETVTIDGETRDLYTLDYSWDCPRDIPTSFEADCIKTEYTQYDNNGNLLEYKVGDHTSVVLIWGYNQTKVVAKIENATYSQVSSLIPNIQSLSNNDNDRTQNYSGNEGLLRQALDALRTSLPDTMITTYTHDPLIGVTSVTDPQGQVNYYEYDDLNRLKEVKDADGKILSHNEYHYKQISN